MSELSRGVARPAGFNLAAIAAGPADLLLVEGPLDAIACCERGHAAIALVGSSVRGELAAALKGIDARIYLALDGTKDVTPLKRCETASELGPACRICVLPEEKDPDDLSGSDLAAVKAAARPCLSEWIGLVGGAGATLTAEGGRIREAFARAVRGWLDAGAAADELMHAIAEGLKMPEADVRTWLGAGRGAEPGNTPTSLKVARAASAWPPPGQPEPRGPPAPAEKRPLVTNWMWQRRWEATKQKATAAGNSEEGRRRLAELRDLGRKFHAGDNSGQAGSGTGMNAGERERLRALVDEFDAAEVSVQIAKPLDEIVRDLQAAFGGWPQRQGLAEIKSPFLFVDLGGFVRELSDDSQLFSWLQGWGVVKWADKRDCDGRNFVSRAELFSALTASPAVRSWLAVERWPHEPPLPQHYYAWRPMEGYEATGETLAALLSMFDNIPLPACRAVFAASLVSLYWGGEYGKRPAIVCEAEQRGSGKTTVAEVAGELTGGALSIDLDRRAEERLKERLLSPEGLLARVALADNVKGSIDSSLLEQLVTAKRISGKRLAVGEASRPNTLSVFITSNNARLSPDMVRRSFYIKCEPPAKTVDERVKWERALREFMRANAAKMAMDAIAILREPLPTMHWGELRTETMGLWASEVLARALNNASVWETIGEITPLEVLQWQAEIRRQTDEERQEAEMFWLGVLERIVVWKGCTELAGPGDNIFIRTEPPHESGVSGFEDSDAGQRRRSELKNNLVEYYREIFTRKDISAKWLVGKVKSWIGSGYIVGLRYVEHYYKHGQRGARGWLVQLEEVKGFLARTTRAATDALNVSDVSDVSAEK